MLEVEGGETAHVLKGEAGKLYMVFYDIQGVACIFFFLEREYFIRITLFSFRP